MTFQSWMQVQKRRVQSSPFRSRGKRFILDHSRLTKFDLSLKRSLKMRWLFRKALSNLWPWYLMDAFKNNISWMSQINYKIFMQNFISFLFISVDVQVVWYLSCRMIVGGEQNGRHWTSCFLPSNYINWKIYINPIRMQNSTSAWFTSNLHCSLQSYLTS